jgi:nitrate/TMAO reductase-like tetraheme cytochrome c subunit
MIAAWLGVLAPAPLAFAQVQGICVNPDPQVLEQWQRLVVSPSGTPNGARQIPGTPASFSILQSGDDLLGDDLLSESNTSQGDDLLSGGDASGGDDPLSSMGPDKALEAKRAQSKQEEKSYLDQNGVDPHAEAFANTMYPSAASCAKCHKQIYDEWRVSAHAYAGVSPMFQRFEEAISHLVNGTVGTFCMRCHAPVATQLKVPRYASILEGPLVLREGVTCVACHRVVERYGRVNGERRIEPGGLNDPVVGNLGGDGIAQVIANADQYKVRTDSRDTRPAQDIHRGSIQFEQLSDSSFCAGCHQVVVQPGIALEIVYQQYRAGPACAKGISCQDCHMGAVPGKAMGYQYGAAAEMSGKILRSDRKHSNHIFHGPSYPISHPGIYPHNEKALRWKPADLVAFDWRNGWGTEEFERAVGANQITGMFPKVWENSQERRDARKVIDENLQLIEVKRANAVATLELSSQIKGPIFRTPPKLGRDLKFEYVVSNLSEGHNMPSGSLGAQPQLWLNVVLIGPNGTRLFESGDVDRNGDLRDLQSLDVQAGLIPADHQLANYQTKFLITNVKGTDREFFFPVPVDVDPIPFFRPGTVPYTVLNHPPLARMEAHSIGPLDSRTEKYQVPGNLIRQSGTYRLSVRLRSRVEPPYFARFVGLPDDSMRMLNERMLDVHGQSIEFIIR